MGERALAGKPGTGLPQIPNVILASCLLAGSVNSYNIRAYVYSPGWVAQLVRALSPYAEVTGSIPCQGTYKNQPVNA